MLRLVRLLQRSHSSRLKDVVLGHFAHGLPHVRIHDAVGSAREILDLSCHDVGGSLEAVHRSADLSALSGNSIDGVVDCTVRAVAAFVSF